MMDVEMELQEVSARAFDLEQEVMRYELRVDFLRKRIAELEEEIERLQGVQVSSLCDNCGAMFMQAKKGRTGRFCSASCRQMHYKSNKDFALAIKSALVAD